MTRQIVQKNWLCVARWLLIFMVYSATSCCAQPFFIDTQVRVMPQLSVIVAGFSPRKITQPKEESTSISCDYRFPSATEGLPTQTIQSISIPIEIKLIATHDILKELNDIEGWKEWEGSGADKCIRLKKEVDDLKRERMGLLIETCAGINWLIGNYGFSVFEHQQSSGNPYFKGDEPDPYLMIRYIRIKELGFTQVINSCRKNFSWSYTVKLLKGQLNFADPIAWEKDVVKKVALEEKGVAETSVTTKLGIDIGLVYCLDKWMLTLKGENLNSPMFFYPPEAHMDSYLLKPQVKIGAAFRPLNSLILDMDCYLTQNETLLQGYKSMELACGAEKRMFNDKLMLRGGIAKNLAEDDIGCVYSLGIGSRIAGLQLNMDGAMSSKTTKRSSTSKDYPAQIQACLQISGKF
ncbi:MAG: conjugal transfer protein TraF [bacterium]